MFRPQVNYQILNQVKRVTKTIDPFYITKNLDPKYLQFSLKKEEKYLFTSIRPPLAPGDPIRSRCAGPVENKYPAASRSFIPRVVLLPRRGAAPVSDSSTAHGPSVLSSERARFIFISPAMIFLPQVDLILPRFFPPAVQAMDISSRPACSSPGCRAYLRKIFRRRRPGSLQIPPEFLCSALADIFVRRPAQLFSRAPSSSSVVSLCALLSSSPRAATPFSLLSSRAVLCRRLRPALAPALVPCSYGGRALRCRALSSLPSLNSPACVLLLTRPAPCAGKSLRASYLLAARGALCSSSSLGHTTD
jgi:hypothetical protein